MGVKLGNDLGSGDDNSIRNIVIGVIPLNSPALVGSIDGDLDGDSTTTDLLALESVDGILLFSLVTNIDETVPLAPSGLTPPGSDDTSRVDLDTRISEESGETSIVDVEAKVGNEENCLGRFTDRVLTSGTRGTGGSGFAFLRLGSILCGRISCGTVCGRSSVLSFARPGLVTALKIAQNDGDVVRVTMPTLYFFFFFLGFSAPSVAGAASALSAASPFASASVTSPGTDLGPRLPADLFLDFFGLYSWSFSSAGLAISMMTERPSRSFVFRASTAFWAASIVVRATKP